MVDVFDVHRALLDARTAGGAAPQHLGVDDAALDGVGDELAIGFVASILRNGVERLLVDVALGIDESDLVARHVLLAAGQQVRGLGVAVIAQRHDQQLGGEGLAGVPGGALRLAAAALGAGGEVEPALPAEVFNFACAERVDVGVGLFHLEDLAAGHHRLGGTEGDGAVVHTLEVDVGEGREAVPRDAPVDAGAHDVEPDHAGHQLDQSKDRHHVGVGRQQLGEAHREEVGVGVRVSVGGDLARLDEHHAQALDEDNGLDEVGGLEPGAGEA